MMQPAKSDRTAPDYPSASYGYYVTFLLLMAYSLSFVDRQILSLMVGPVKADLQLSDTEISILHGFAFAIFYTLIGLFMGRIADRFNRRRLIIAGIIVWCSATALCGFARDFWELFLARVLVGAGEACLSPAAYSLIADYFAPSKRARPIGLYSLGVYLGSGLAFIVGGLVVAATAADGVTLVPLLGEFRSWQLAFLIVALPGVIVVPLMLTISEPPRRELHSAPIGMSHFADNARVYGFSMLGYAVLAIVTFAYSAWIPATFTRAWGWSAAEIGLAFGTMMMLIGGGSMLTAGWLSDRLVQRGMIDAPFRIALWSAGFAIVPAALFGLAATPGVALVFVGLTIFFISAPIALAPTVLQGVTPNQLRGQATALYLFLVNLIGAGLGPTLVALYTDCIFADEKRVGTSIAIVTTLAAILTVLLLLQARHAYRAMIAARAATAQP